VASGDRTIGLDELLNVVDGIESKAAELIVVLSTNDLDSIHEAMLRPGRIDGVITFREPDAKATEKLLRVYLGDLLDADEDISEASKLLAGNKTAAVREAATRVKAAAIWSTGEVPTKVTAGDLRQAAMSVVNQMNSLIRDPKEKHSEIVKAARVLADGMALATPNGQAMAAEAFLASTNPFTEHPKMGAPEDRVSWEKRLSDEGRYPEEALGDLSREIEPKK
jgi:SpoVK/Ycf46/Vps4 family AAA+-type ATPase